MKKVKAGLRLLIMILLLTLAAFGIGMMQVFSGNREPYMNRQIRKEKLDKKDDEEKED